MAKQFTSTPQNRPGKSAFQLNSYRLFDCDLGQLIPVLTKKMVPGDMFRIRNEILIRANPLVAPIMHEINCFVHYFFVPLRLLWPKPDYGIPGVTLDVSSWEEFFTGGVDGTLTPSKPKWIPETPAHVALHTLWDYMGHPVDVVPSGFYPDAWQKRAYNLVYNEYYRDQNYMNPVDLDSNDVKRRCWEKDYFTTALPWTQRGQAPALPVTGYTEFLGAIFASGSAGPTGRQAFFSPGEMPSPQITLNNYSNSPIFPGESAIRGWFNNNKLEATTFDVNDLRLAFQIQKFLERNARAGGRYIEQLKIRYGTSPRDDRMQRPEYVGGTRTPVVVSEVLQTSQTDQSPQGTLAGHGMSVDRRRVSSYYAPEFGILIGIMSLMPRPVYQQGIDREWYGETRYDELIPEFVTLGEQPIYRAEIYASSVEAENKTVFGFRPRYDEYRVDNNKVCGLMRSYVSENLGFWHIARQFDTPPALNAEFLECNPRKDYLAVPSKPGWIVTCGHSIRAVRPLPFYGVPGLIDHH